MNFQPVPANKLRHSAVFFSLSVPTGALVFLWVLLLALAGGAVYSVFGSIDEWARGTAMLRPLVEVAEVRNETSGRVSRRPVEHGQHVAAGQTLWVIDTEVIEAEIAGLETEHTRTQQELAEQQAVVASLQAGENQVPPELENASRQVDLLLLEHTRLQLQTEDARRAWQREDQAPTSLRRSDRVEELERSYRMQRLSLDGFLPQELVSRTERIRTLESRLNEIQQSLTASRKRLSESHVVAPVDGTVELVRDFSTGAFVGAGEELMRVVPQLSDRFRLIVEVPEREAAEVSEGQQIVLRFSGFPVAEYGSAYAEVAYVPQDAEQGADGQPVYRVRAELARTYLTDRDGRNFPLRPGMTANARIITRTTPIYRYILRKMDIRT
ncbi:HlyD family secretion protein [Spirochaeta africana]|uniref:Multidrug resistance efflux pump n=1 Tax=Spirochaeta africana (strain ATCC 700263 / DSM 8902 / Z-7692) TaxID=889378 RepID=H9UH68_SPIAZ|nr:HlyD family efflux transporter periplasmic adaptor subunit [Spirochaeta africana]AFG36861.1 multidrug resistance efflux pump [Spirochaeta africana DSM 8902]